VTTPKVHWYFLGDGEVRAFGLSVDLVYHLMIARHNYDGHGSRGFEFCILQLILQHRKHSTSLGILCCIAVHLIWTCQ
jgi:hypothetical protein